jgi:hypothetical protein
MRRIRPVSRTPERAASIAPEVKLTFIINVFTAAATVFSGKTGTTDTTAT